MTVEIVENCWPYLASGVPMPPILRAAVPVAAVDATVAADRSRVRADRTRAAILAAAEDLFSRRGFEATRLEDVADAVQVSRAALFYYYRDKNALYSAMLDSVFGVFGQRLEDLIAPERGTVVQRIESAVDAWVDAVIARPTMARLILRFVADGSEQPATQIFSDRIPLKFWALFEEGRATGELKPLHADPFHTASALIGTSVFYVAAIAALVPHGQFEPLAPEQVAAHKQEALLTTRRLLGMADRGAAAQP